MSKENDELREFKRIVEELARDARSSSDLGTKLIDDASAKFEDYVARRQIESPVEDVGARATIRRLWVWVKRQYQSIDRGPALPDPLARGYVERLAQEGKLSLQQLRIVNLFRVIQFRSNGETIAQLPTRTTYRLALLIVAILIVATVATSLLVWSYASEIDAGIPLAYTAGALLGFGFRRVYDWTWGREKLVHFLTRSQPWLTVVRR